MDKKNTMLLTVIAIATLLVAVVGATFAYFSVTSQNTATATSATGNATSKGSAITLSTTTASLLINLDATYMAQAKAGTTYYAPSQTADPTGIPIVATGEKPIALGNGIYTLASALVADGETKYDCTYGYKVTATVTTPITDASDSDIKVKISGAVDSTSDGYNAAGYVEYTLAQLTTAGATGKSFTGKFAGLVPGTPQTITIQSTVDNTAKVQDNLAGNGYIITVTPTAGTGTTGFSCKAVA